jgi:hypothetical protein
LSRKETQAVTNNSEELNQEPELLEFPELTPAQKWQGIQLFILGWFIPGTAHWMLGLKKKALIFFVMLNGLFIWGMALRGEIAVPVMDVHSNEFNLVNILIFLLGIGNGSMCLANMMPSFHLGDPSVRSFEVGTLFMVVSGAMNMFAAFHAWDWYRLHLTGNKKVKSND